MLMSIQLPLDRHVQGGPSPEPAAESIGREKFLIISLSIGYSLSEISIVFYISKTITMLYFGKIYPGLSIIF